MKTLITLILTLIMSFTSTSMLWTSIELPMDEPVETPVAYIENDDYVPYQYRNYTQQDTAIEKLDFEPKANFQTVLKTITVMTTATGDPKRGNYVASRPIEDALVRVDGVPRYTNDKGQITAPLNRKYVELYIEYNGYNPYIEIIEATPEEKVVNLKQPNDDIEIYAAMLNYAGEEFNVLTQPCIINNDVIKYHYSELIISTNVEADEYYILVNGELREFSDEAIFYDIKFDDLIPGDKISVQVSYSGIRSKEVDAFISVEELDLEEEVMTFSLRSQDDEDLSVGVNTDNDLGIFSGLDINFEELAKAFGAMKLSKLLGAITDFQLNYDIRTGEFSIRIGFTIDGDIIKQKEKKIEEATENIKRNCEEMKDIHKQIKANNAELAINDAAYKRALAEQKEKDPIYDAEIQRLKRQRREIKNKGLNMRKKTKEKSAASKAKQQEKTAAIQEVQDAKQELDDKVTRLLDAVTKGKETIDGLKSKLNMLQGITRQEMAKFNSSSKSLSVGLDIIGVFIFNVKEKSVKKLSMSASLHFDFSWSGMFLAYVVPMYYKVNVGVHGGVDINFYDNKAWMPWEKVLENLLLKVGLKARGEIGVGVCNILTVGAFLGLDYEAQVYPGAKDENGLLYIKQGDKWGHKINIKIGVTVNALLWDWEFGKEFNLLNKPVVSPMNVDYYNIDHNMELLARSYENNTSRLLSSNEIFGGTYQESKPQIAVLGDKIILTWIDDDPTRDDFNRSVLKFSIFDNGKWSEPKAVFDDGKADFYHNTYYDGEDLHIVWQKFSRQMSAKDDLISSGASSELYYAKFDQVAGNFERAERLTNNGNGDFTPTFALKEKSSDPLTIIWRKNSENNILGFSGVNEIYTMTKYTSSWSAPESIYISDKYFSFVSSAYKDGALNTALTEFSGLEVDSVRQVKVVCGENINVIAEGQTLNNSQFSIVDGRALLSYYDKDIVALSRDLANMETFAGLQKNKISDDYVILSHGGGNKTIVYKKMGQDKISQIYCARFDGVSKKWTYDIPLTYESQNITKWTAQLDSQDQVMLTYSLMDENKNSVTCFASRQFKSDFEVLDVSINEIPKWGAEASFIVALNNTGDYDLEEITVRAFGAVQSVDGSVAVGETGYFSVTFLLPDKLSAQERFTVEAVGQSREYVVSLSFVDVSLSGEIVIENGQQIFIIDVKNNGDIDSNCSINIYRNGNLIKTEEVLITANGQKQLRYILEDLYQGDTLCFEIITNENDITTIDNSTLINSEIDTVKIIDENSNKYIEILQEAKRLL